MRPVDRGAPPPEAPFTKYGEAFDPLSERIGRYCSYCERRIPVSLAVEHVQPKSLEPGLELEWSNFLLGCANCNSVKGNKSVEIDDFLWPDRDNTAMAFTYHEGIVDLDDRLGPAERDLGEATVELVGLDRFPGAENEPAPADKRWKDRLEALARARECRETLEEEDTDAVRRLISVIAEQNGFWSIWFEVFQDDPDMRERLFVVLNGTSAGCFDGAFNLIPRPGGQV